MKRQDFGYIQTKLPIIWEDESRCVCCHKICKKMALSQGTCLSCQQSAVMTKFCPHCEATQLFSQREYDYNAPFVCSCQRQIRPLACRWEREADREADREAWRRIKHGHEQIPAPI